MIPTSGCKVAVNLLWCVPGQVGGSEQYLVRQLSGLATQSSRFDVTLFCSPEFAEVHPELVEAYPVVTAGRSASTRMTRIVAENTWLRQHTKNADVVHHGGGTAPLGGSQPTVLTIHDLQYLTYPDYLSPIKLQYLKAVVPRAARRAAIIAVPTDYVKETVTTAFGIEPNRVVVVPHGVEPSLGLNAPDETELRRIYGLGSGRVLVFPAMTHPHKGHRFLLDVLAGHWKDPELRLVLLGGAGSVEAEVTKSILGLGLEHQVIRTGRVPDAHRDGLISLASALVFPSEYEGFGAPVVEAMALGTPVICSDQLALVEVVGQAGLVLPLKSDAWADALDQLDARSAEMIAMGRQRATEFTSAKSGAALAAAYAAAAGGGQ